MSHIRKITYRAGLLDPVNLTTIEKIDNALDEFGAVLNEANYVQALGGLLEQTHIVELLLSNISEEIPLQKWILDGFPTDPMSYHSSFSCKLLSQLSHYFLFHPSSNQDFDYSMSDCHQIIKNALDVVRIPFASIFLDENKQCPERPAPSKKFQAKGSSSQKEDKRRKKAAAQSNNVLDEKAFVALSIPVPRSQSEAESTISSLLAKLKTVLEYYLRRLRTAEVSLGIKEGFIPQERPDEMTVVTEVCVPTEDSIPAAPTTATVPPAFPMVQPIKSAWIFDSPEGFGEWRILIASGAHGDLRVFHKKESNMYDIVIRKIKQLSKGHFSADNQKRLKGPSTEVPIFEAKLTGDLRLVYQVDCVASDDNKREQQVLRIFGIFTHAQMDKNRLWESVAAHITRRGKEYRQRCLERIRVNAGGDVYLPARFSLQPEPETKENGDMDILVPDLPEDDSNELHKFLTLEKYVTLSKELLDSIEADHDAAFPFEVSTHEKAVIQHPFSCYVLGRSGTGKTTTMLFKMLWIERAYQMSIEHTARPRQVFVTKSRKLAQKVEEHFTKYLVSLVFSSETRRDIQALKSRTGQQDGDDENLWNEDDDAEWRNDLPKRFSQLEDCHFPLFLTFDQLCSMLEADINEAEEYSTNAFSTAQPTSAIRQTNTLAKRKLVTFDRFLGDYWPHFTQSLRKNLHPSLVYSEIMGVICGSEGSINSANGYLDRETYESLSFRSQPTFADHRSNVYEIFLSYRKIKNSLNDFDVADRTHAILRALKDRPLMGQRVDFLYVDETQDNLLIETLLLRMLCRNPDGLFWAGDTAQTISAGSSFRFKDLKAFLHRIEQRRKLTQGGALMKQKLTPPKAFHLAVNYRSHAGIVNCAHTVVKLISSFWPYSIDALSRERGNANGAKPIFFTNVVEGFVGQFLLRGDSTDNIELGAHQCILVRDDDAKEKLLAQIGKIGIVLTIYDSKGLEFNDVFLYNFFHDSAIDASQWRVVLNGLPRESSCPAPQFDTTRHAALCPELKSLYVAITRARNILWIADESLKGESMRALWANSNQIRTCEPGEELFNFASPSRPEEWAERAKEFFDNQQYALARDGYERANKPHAAAIADAYHQREIARRTPAGSGKTKGTTRNAAFRSAAHAFYSSACSTADPKAKKDYYRVSAECYEDAGEFLRAAEIYQLIENYTKSVVLFRKAGKFGDVHQLIVNFADEIEPNALEAVRDVVRLYHVTRKDFEKAHQLFETVEEEIEYLEDRNLDLAHVDLLLLHGRSVEAAELHLGEGRILQAVDIFLSDKENREASMQRAHDCILEGLWALLPLGVSMSTVDSEVVDALLSRSELLDQGLLSKNDHDEFAMFKIIRLNEFEKLSELASSFVLANNSNPALLCFDHYFTQTPSLVDMDIAAMEGCLTQFFDYIYILHQVAFVVDPCTEPRVWKLLGAKWNELEEKFLIPPGTLLHHHAMRSSTIISDSSIPLKFTQNQYAEVFHSAIRERLLDRVTRENDMCRKAPALSVCLRPIVYGDCNATLCPRSHINPDSEWFQHWLSVHLLQILVYHSVWRIQYRAEMLSQQRFWILKLHEVLNPPHFSLGSSANVNLNNSVKIRKGFGVAIEWVRAISYTLDFWPSNYDFLTIALGAADLAFTFDRKEASVYMFRSEFARERCPQEYLRGQDAQNSILEVLVSFRNKEPSSLLMGILFIRHVMEVKIAVDINVFLNFIEKICGLLIVCNRYRWNQSFHNITLPSSWWVSILTDFDSIQASQQDSTGRFWLLLQPLGALLRGLYFSYYSIDHLRYGPEYSVRTQDTTVRTIYIARVCRALGLLGYNIAVGNFRTEIHTHITSLRRQPNRGFSKPYASYVYAKNFDEIGKATRRSIQGSPLDEMVELLQISRTQFPVHDIFALRRVVYKSQEDILNLLRRSSLVSITFDSGSAAHSQSNTLSENGVGTAVPIASATEVEEISVNSIEDEHIPSLEEHPGESVEEDPNFIPRTEIPDDVYVGHSEEELAAIPVIERIYRISMERRRRLDKAGLEGGVHRYFREYLDAFQPSMGQGYFPRYKTWFLGPLPHILASLDAIQVLVSAKKAELKGMLLDEKTNHQLLDEVGLGLTHMQSVTKAIHHHRQMLGPKAAMHLRHDVLLLQKTMRETLHSLSNLPVHLLTDEIRQELSYVEKIMEQPECSSNLPLNHHVTKKEKRPALSIEDPTDPLDFGNWEDDQDV